jgi:3-methyladenine DNA glycosylase AlkD
MISSSLTTIRSLLNQASQMGPVSKAIFYKTGPGDYAEHDRFMGVSVPTLRKIAKEFPVLSLSEIESLLMSPFNEERFLGLVILVQQYQKGNIEDQKERYNFYLNNLKYVNNWNLVDVSAHLIVGAHLLDKDRSILQQLVLSNDLWERRVSIVSTWAFIRKKDLEWTFQIGEKLLKDPHDLIHKAVGWMLREAGKQDEAALKNFLGHHVSSMPRTMLRYAIERFEKEERERYLGGINSKLFHS